MRRSFFCCSTALTACVIVGACAASAQTSASRFYVVEVTAPSEEALHALVEMPFITDNVEGLTATLYLDEDQYAQVRAMGYPLRLLKHSRIRWPVTAGPSPGRNRPFSRGTRPPIRGCAAWAVSAVRAGQL